MKDFNGYSFTDPEIRKRMKYMVITAGDLDINNAYAFETKESLDIYLEQTKECWYSSVLSVFEINDITKQGE